MNQERWSGAQRRDAMCVPGPEALLGGQGGASKEQMAIVEDTARLQQQVAPCSQTAGVARPTTKRHAGGARGVLKPACQGWNPCSQ